VIDIDIYKKLNEKLEEFKAENPTA